MQNLSEMYAPNSQPSAAELLAALLAQKQPPEPGTMQLAGDVVPHPVLSSGDRLQEIIRRQVDNAIMNTSSNRTNVQPIKTPLPVVPNSPWAGR